MTDEELQTLTRGQVAETILSQQARIAELEVQAAFREEVIASQNRKIAELTRERSGGGVDDDMRNALCIGWRQR